MMTKGFKVVEHDDEYRLGIYMIEDKSFPNMGMDFISIPKDSPDMILHDYDNIIDQKYIDMVFDIINKNIIGGCGVIKEYMITSDPSKEIEAVVIIKNPKNQYLAIYVDKNYNEELEWGFFDFLYDVNLKAVSFDENCKFSNFIKEE